MGKGVPSCSYIGILESVVTIVFLYLLMWLILTTSNLISDMTIWPNVYNHDSHLSSYFITDPGEEQARATVKQTCWMLMFTTLRTLISSENWGGVRRTARNTEALRVTSTMAWWRMSGIRDLSQDYQNYPDNIWIRDERELHPELRLNSPWEEDTADNNWLVVDHSHTDTMLRYSMINTFLKLPMVAWQTSLKKTRTLDFSNILIFSWGTWATVWGRGQERRGYWTWSTLRLEEENWWQY